LDVVFEESDHHHQLRQQHHLLLQQQQQQYQPSPSLNFLRPKPTYSTPYSSTESTTSTNNSLPTVRRARAGTMPSFIHPEMTNNNRPTNNSSAALLLTTIEAGRHRSGSLNLPPPVDGSFWSIRHDAPLSPSSEQLLQSDSDFSIARTMRSLGLEEDEEKQQAPPAPIQTENEPLINSLFHHQSPPEFHMPSRSLLSGNNRNRSYSVNATARYEENNNNSRLSRASSLNNKLSFASPLEGFARQQQSRPRASSMGRADAGRMGLLPPPPPMGFWNTANGNGNQRGSPLVSMREEDYETSSNTSSNQQQPLSLGDSELLANILGKEEELEEDMIPNPMMMEV
jgi:hypothetical protein